MTTALDTQVRLDAATLDTKPIGYRNIGHTNNLIGWLNPLDTCRLDTIQKPVPWDRLDTARLDTEPIRHGKIVHRTNWTYYDGKHDNIRCTGPIGHRNSGYTGLKAPQGPTTCRLNSSRKRNSINPRLSNFSSRVSGSLWPWCSWWSRSPPIRMKMLNYSTIEV